MLAVVRAITLKACRFFLLFIGCHKNNDTVFFLLCSMFFTSLVALAFDERYVFVLCLLIMFVKLTTFCSSISYFSCAVYFTVYFKYI